jgi:hypothetical protein
LTPEFDYGLREPGQRGRTGPGHGDPKPSDGSSVEATDYTKTFDGSARTTMRRSVRSRSVILQQQAAHGRWDGKHGVLVSVATAVNGKDLSAADLWRRHHLQINERTSSKV